MKRLILVSICIGLCQPTVSSPQPRPATAQSCGVWGRLIAPTSYLDGAVEVQLSGGNRKIHRKARLIDGAFSFDPVPAGRYQLCISSSNGRPIAIATEQLKGSNDHIWLHLSLLSTDAVAPETVSVRDLLGQAQSKRAFSAFQEGRKAAEAGDISKSISSFNNALAVNPRFALAEFNLAIEYMRMGNLELAIEHAESAYAMNTNHPDGARFLASLLIRAKRYAEAERVIRPALTAPTTGSELQALLTVSMIQQHEDIDDALAHLKIGVTEFPMGRLLVADAFIDINRIALAAVQVREYIRSSASECERRYLKSWLDKADGLASSLTAQK